MRPERCAGVFSLRSRPPIPPPSPGWFSLRKAARVRGAIPPPLQRGRPGQESGWGCSGARIHCGARFAGRRPLQRAETPPSPPLRSGTSPAEEDFSAKSRALLRRYSSPSSEGEVRWGWRAARRTSPQGDFSGGPKHPHPLRFAPGLPPLKRGKDNFCGSKPFRRGILRGRGSRGAARIAATGPFRRILCQTGRARRPGQGNRPTPCFFGPFAGNGPRKAGQRHKDYYPSVRAFASQSAGRSGSPLSRKARRRKALPAPPPEAPRAADGRSGNFCKRWNGLSS